MDPEKLDIKWHVPTDEETQCAIELFQTAVEFQLNILDELLNVKPHSADQKKPDADWTDEFRQALKYIVTALVASIPLYQRCPPPEEWEVTHEEMPNAAETFPDGTDMGSPDIEDDDAAGDDEDDDDTGAGRAQKYDDGFINRSLTPEQTELLKSLYKRIGRTLLDASRYLWGKRRDDMSTFIEVSTVYFQVNLTYIRLFIRGYILREWGA
jgi:Proteasome-substrate-size regulator, mid region